jgi:hypothetical protein
MINTGAIGWVAFKAPSYVWHYSSRGIVLAAASLLI